MRVIRERCPNALNILDLFHIVAKMNKALDDVRAAEVRRLARDGYEPVLHKTRWCVLKRKANLTRTQRFRLRDLFHDNLETVRVSLSTIFDVTTWESWSRYVMFRAMFSSAN